MMLPGKDRPAIGRIAVAILVIVVIVIGGAVGISFPKPGQGAVVTSTVAPSTFTSASASSTSTRSALSTTSSSIATTSLVTASAPLFHFILSSLPDRILLSPGANLTYASISVIPLPSSREVQGLPLEVGAELVVLNATVPSGLHLRYFGSNLVNRIYVEVSLSSQMGVGLNLAADKNVAPGDYTITMEGASGNYTSKVSFTVRVAQYLVFASGGQFSPANLTVKVGSTVYWLNFEDQGGPESTYDVVFDALKVQSPTLNGGVYDSFSYTFTTAGTYSYYCSVQAVTITGTIVVTN
jgi:plastocyanin